MFRNKILLTLAAFFVLQTSCEKYKNLPESNVVINELMAVNSTIVTDQNGEYDDWIEMFNKSSLTMDLSGYYLTDSKRNLVKWQFPAGTTVPSNGYLIIWADSDTTQNGLHSNFKLSSGGERLLFVNPEKLIIDEVDYPAQTQELSYSRNPNGTGSFIWQSATFSTKND
ncbi:MAG: lamin tail domain-containing protein [Bacteroidales bacterium]|nr:lamin tail domain-containing protein [Bacteroidales bacterium]